jgi:protocatechuate 3,4-dioxygenase beta subunit
MSKLISGKTDLTGHYDVQYAEREGPNGRAVLRTDEKGDFWFKAIVLVPYPVPHDGPVGRLLKILHRHPYRPSHVHFMFEKPGYDYLITYVIPKYNRIKYYISDRHSRALYLRNDPYETSDAVFGVKDSLLLDLQTLTDEKIATQYDVKVGIKFIRYDFVLVSDAEAQQLREEKAMEAMAAQGRTMKLLNGLPVPDVD